MDKKIVILSSYAFSTVAVYNYLKRYYFIEKVITEDPMRGMALAKRRIKKLGLWKVGGQVVFSVSIVPLLRFVSRKRIHQIKKDFSFDETPIPPDQVRHFSSVNDEECISFLREIQPDIVVVNGTRIISKKVLESTNAVFINMRTGITPKYRGVHGGYWAMVNNDRENCGVTVHRVDRGIDTGDVLYQNCINVTKKDNYATYPYLQLGEGIPLMHKAIEDIINNRLVSQKSLTTESKLWYHPTFWQYIWFRISKGKK